MILQDYGALKRFRAQIDKIGLSVNDPTLFQDIQEACQNQQAFFFSESSSFAVLTFSHTSLLIWLAYSSMSNGLPVYLPVFENMGREVGSTHIEFWSTRKGFLKIMPSLGWNHAKSLWKEKPILVWSKPL